jgi:hypothetical protein
VGLSDYSIQIDPKKPQYRYKNAKKKDIKERSSAPFVRVFRIISQEIQKAHIL